MTDNQLCRSQELLARAVVFDLHHYFPSVTEENMMKVMMILFRGHENPSRVEQIIKEVFNDKISSRC